MIARTAKPAVAVLAVAGLSLLAPAGAAGQSSPQPFAPYYGSIPFRCELQDAGTGTEFPDPEADPFCVKYDKTSQNVTDFGLVDFLSKEPARVAAATPKCFYFQRDEWTGYVVQGEQPELWHWNGNYFFDKARGVGGVSVRGFRIGGQPMSAKPFAPPAYQPYFDETGGGGFLSQLEGPPDPACAAMVDSPKERARVYEDESVFRGCIEPGGEVRRRRVGRVALGMSRRALHRRLGEPHSTRRRVDRWCVIGGATLKAAYVRERGGRSRGGGTRRVAIVRTTARGHTVRRVGPGSSRRRAERRLGLEYRFRVGNTRVFEAKRAGDRRLFAGVRGARVRWLALAHPQRLDRASALRRSLRRARK